MEAGRPARQGGYGTVPRTAKPKDFDAGAQTAAGDFQHRQKGNRGQSGEGPPANAVPAGNDAPGRAAEGTKKAVRDIYDKAESMHMQLLQLPEGLSRENPWNLPLNAMQRELICRYGLWKRIRFFDKK